MSGVEEQIGSVIESAEAPKILTREAIQQVMHPYIIGNFIMPDEIVIAADGKTATGKMVIPADRDFTRDHLNGVLPGVIHVEFAQQVGAAMLTPQFPEYGAMSHEFQGSPGAILSVGDVAIAEVRINDLLLRKGKPDMARFDATVHNQDKPDMRTRISFALRIMNKRLLDRLIRPKSV